jgi:hypothetical protein
MTRVARFVVFMAIAVVAMAACGSSSTGDAVNPTSEAGSAAVSSAVIDPDSCAGVLTPIEGDLKLFTDSLTSTVNTSKPQIKSMCSAMYDTSLPGSEFLSVLLIRLESDDAAVEHYELMKSPYTETGAEISEINNADDNLIDQISALIDSNGVGQITVMRQRSWIVSVTTGPSMAESLWNAGDLESIALAVLDRVK